MDRLRCCVCGRFMSDKDKIECTVIWYDFPQFSTDEMWYHLSCKQLVCRGSSDL